MAQPASARPAGGAGPIGQPRKPLNVILLSIFTCGIYGIVWDYKSFEELKQHRGEGLGGLVGLLLSFVVVGYFMLASEIQQAYEADGKESPVTAMTGLWILISPVYQWKIQTALNDYWVSKGATPVA